MVSEREDVIMKALQVDRFGDGQTWPSVSWKEKNGLSILFHHSTLQRRVISLGISNGVYTF